MADGFGFFGTKKKGDSVTLTASGRREADSQDGRVSGIRSDILWYLKSTGSSDLQAVSRETNHSFQAVRSVVEALQKEQPPKVEWI